jgi:hypothetical protein
MNEKRGSPRLPVTAPVICSRYGKRMTMRGLDISQQGLKLEANFDLQLGELLDFVILLNSTEIPCRGKVVAIEELGYKVRARVRFTRTASSEQRKLRPERRHVGENRQLESDMSGDQAPTSKMEAGLKPPEEGAPSDKERVLPVLPGRAVFSKGRDVREPSTEIANSRPSAIISESRGESEIIQDASGDPEQAKLEDQEWGEVSGTEAEVLPPSSGRRIQAAVVSTDAPPRVNRPVIRRSTIALGVEGREPVGMSKRIGPSGSGLLLDPCHQLQGRSRHCALDRREGKKDRGCPSSFGLQQLADLVLSLSPAKHDRPCTG